MAKNNQGFISLPGTSGGPSTQTFEGIPEGMNVALPPQELSDTAARYVQDILLDKPGLIRRRGPLNPTPEAFPSMPFKASGIVTTPDPLGTNKIAVLNGDATHGQLSFLNPAFTAVNASYPWNGNLTTAPPASPYHLVDAKPALGDGVLIGTSSRYDANSPTQSLAFWRGGINADYSTGTITVARGSTAVTGSGTTWTTNVSPGEFLFATTDDGYTLTYVGVIAAVLTDTTLTLKTPSGYPVTAKAYKASSIRGFCPRVTTGFITVTAAATAVTGSNTKFVSQLTGTATNWNLYRSSDYAWIGKVSAIVSPTSLTLAAGATVSLNNEAYIAVNAGGDWGISTQSNATNKVGFLNAVYAERQWYANNGSNSTQTNRVYFSALTDPEDVDLSSWDGNFITVASSSNYNTPITGLAPSYNALLVFKENETFGVFGNTPSTFAVQKIEDDGTLAVGSIQTYGGGAIWAGRTGIFFYDGVQTTNIVAGTLGNWYKDLVRSINPGQYRMWSTIARDHYFLFLEQCNPTVPVIKGNVSTSTSHLCIVINMISRAPTIFTNFSLRGGVQMPNSTGLGTLFVVNSNANVGLICSSNHVFSDTGNDTFISDLDTAAGPDFYIESKKYNADDSLILKLWTQLILNYQAGGAALNIDTVVGLNDIGVTSTTQLPPTIYTWDKLKLTFNTWDILKFNEATWAAILNSVFLPKRVRFLKRSQNFAFRIWQSSGSVNNVSIGPFQLGYKKMRPGRI